jgi:hypothetical protein
LVNSKEDDESNNSPFSKGGLTPLEVSPVKGAEQEALGTQHKTTLLTGLMESKKL